MPIVDHASVPETPWRDDYRMFNIAGPAQGVTVGLSYSEVGPGAGAPLHTHQDDELIVVLEGALDVRIGDEVATAGRDSTVVVPAGVPHGFTAVGETPARLLGFFPAHDAFERTEYLEGGPPQAHSV